MLPSSRFSDINALWAFLTIEELSRCGVDHFCIAPGSRSAPWAIAIAENPKINSTVHFDERGIGFYALGRASANGKPVAVLTTSATASANLLPSMIEASKKKLPMVILTADRPPELRATGANQTIDQVKIFGDYARFFFDFPCPTVEIPPEAVLTTIDQAVFRSQGELPGPVHINGMFREPLCPAQNPSKNFSAYLKPLKNWFLSKRPYTRYLKPRMILSADVLEESTKIIDNARNGIIVAGKLSGDQDQKALLTWAEQIQWPVFADITSNLRLGQKSAVVIHHFEHLLSENFPAKSVPVDCVVHFGGRLTSPRWYKWVGRQRLREYIMVLKHPLRNDPGHSVTLRVQSGTAEFCESLMPFISKRNRSVFLKQWQKADRACGRIIEQTLDKKTTALTEPVISRLLTQLIPAQSGLFLGNSMPIRDLGLFADASGAGVKITANRGASGIDGNIATAAGFASVLKKSCIALIGDLAVLHDINSLNFLRTMQTPFVLIVLNNNGGSIFSFLPVSRIRTGFTKFFATPHDLNFQQAAGLFGLSYQKISCADEFAGALKTALKRPFPVMLEIPTDTRQNLICHKSIANKIKKIKKIF